MKQWPKHYWASGTAAGCWLLLWPCPACGGPCGALQGSGARQQVAGLAACDVLHQGGCGGMRRQRRVLGWAGCVAILPCCADCTAVLWLYRGVLLLAHGQALAWLAAAAAGAGHAPGSCRQLEMQTPAACGAVGAGAGAGVAAGRCRGAVGAGIAAGSAGMWWKVGVSLQSCCAVFGHGCCLQWAGCPA